MNKEELRNVDGSDSLHPNRSGDVVVVLRPPYQSDAGTDGQAIALSHFFGQHGYLPNTVDLANNINMHGTFVIGGPGHQAQGHGRGPAGDRHRADARVPDGDPRPAERPRARSSTTSSSTAENLHEVTILDISDYHGQLTPLAETADNLAAPGVNASFGIGGAAFLKPWFDIYGPRRRRAATKHPSVIEVAAGDSIGGATPPISNFFGDKPTIEIMNMMGIDIDGLGNHNFDHGPDYFRDDADPARATSRSSRRTSSTRTARRPAEWSPSHDVQVRRRHQGRRSSASRTTTTPALVFPGNARSVPRRDRSLPAVNAEAARLAKQVDAIVAHRPPRRDRRDADRPDRAAASTSPTASRTSTSVIGDHTDLQVLTTLRPNGVLVTENRSKGLRFTRVRIVIGPGKDGVVYKTADFHKPWDIGVTPDPAIQAKIDDLNAQLAPIFNTVDRRVDEVDPARRRVRRRRPHGRPACESLVGDLVTDAMRTDVQLDATSRSPTRAACAPT